MTSTPTAASTESATEHPDLFVRNATGLVREVSPRLALGLNFATGGPVLAIGYGLLFGLAGFPGGNFYLALLLTVPMCLGFTYSFGLLTAAIPRTGGDYTLVSRILGPLPGLVSSFCMTLAQFLSVAFIALGLVTLALGPGLTVIGLVAGADGLVDAGNTLATSKGWQFAAGATAIVVVGGVMAVGYTLMKRVMVSLFLFTFAGLVFAVVVALLTSRAGFIDAFNDFARPLTGDADTYRSIIATAEADGVDTSPGFSFSNTFPLLGITAAFGIYAYWTSFLGGELRQGSSVGTANRMAFGGLLSLATIAVFVFILFRGWGKDFLTAAFGGGFPEELGTAPGYFFMTSAQLGSTVVAVLMAASFAAFWVFAIAQINLQPTRTFFAMSFDGILPSAIANVSGDNAPRVAVLVTTVLNLAVFAWALFVADSFLQILTYATLIQLVSMMLVGLAAIVFPFLRPELYRGSASARAVAGIPLTVIAGVLAIASGIVIWIVFFSYDYFGLADKGKFFLWLGATIAAAILFYLGVRTYRARQGVDVRLAYAEIPPE